MRAFLALLAAAIWLAGCSSAGVGYQGAKPGRPGEGAGYRPPPTRVNATRMPAWPNRYAAVPQAGVRSEHRVVPGDEARPGVTPSCRTFWASVNPAFTTNELGVEWTEEWERFHAMCDGGGGVDSSR